MIKDKVKNLLLYRKVKLIYKKYERQIIPGALVFGFVVDVITFRSIDMVLAFVLLIIHIILVGLAIAFINIYDEHWVSRQGKFMGYLRILSPLVMQFSFGALLSASFIFYSFGGVFSVSWPLIVSIFFLMISNEIFKESYLKSSIQLSVFFFTLITFFSYVLPYVFNSISPWIFILSGIVSLLAIYIYIFILAKKVAEIRKKYKRLIIYIVTIFLFINGLYFLNIIPPIPLSLRDIGVYNNVFHVGQNYELTAEKQSVFQKLIPGLTINIVDKKSIYVFSAVFSPVDLNTEIVHHWQRYDERSEKWFFSKIFFCYFWGKE